MIRRELNPGSPSSTLSALSDPANGLRKGGGMWLLCGGGGGGSCRRRFLGGCCRGYRLLGGRSDIRFLGRSR